MTLSVKIVTHAPIVVTTVMSVITIKGRKRGQMIDKIEELIAAAKEFRDGSREYDQLRHEVTVLQIQWDALSRQIEAKRNLLDSLALRSDHFERLRDAANNYVDDEDESESE